MPVCINLHMYSCMYSADIKFLRRQPGHNTPRYTQFPGHGCMDDLTTECSFDSQATYCVIAVLGPFSDMLPMGVCTPCTC